MDKNQAKLFALSLLGTLMMLFGRLPKVGLVIQILTDIINNYWDQGWEQFNKKHGMRTQQALPPDEMDSILAAIQEAAKAK